MTTITLRGTKGSPLTNAEVDTNFSNLNTYKVEQTSATGAAALPTGSTAQRPASPVAGNIRYNASTGKFEGYGSAWGNIGGGAAIGDTAPSNPGNGDFWWNSTDGHLYIYYADVDNGQWVDAFAGGQGQYLPLTGGTISGNLYATGNVGIGTSSPGCKLDVLGGSSAIIRIASSGDLTTGAAAYVRMAGSNSLTAGYVGFGGSASAFDVWNDLNGPINFGTNGLLRARIDSSGNLLVGKSSANGYLLDVGGAFSALSRFNSYTADGLFGATANPSTIFTPGGNSIRFGYYDVGSGNYVPRIGFYQSSPNTAASWAIGNNVDGSFGIFSGTTERARIDSSGNLLVGTTGSPVGNARFRAVNATSDWSFGPNAGSSFLVYNASSVGVYISTGATSWTATSDERLKTDLKPIENAASKVSTLRAVTGRFNTDEEGVSRSFLIAQDVQAVLPEAVDAEDPEKLGVRYTDTIPLLVAAIKELSARLEALEAN